MIQRRVYKEVEAGLNRQAAVALIGPRQSGKTTLALEIAKRRKALYLDLESYADRQKLADPISFLQSYEDTLVILDEIHRLPEIFQALRGIIDEGRRKGKGIGRFLILGSASIDLLRQTGESLAGRIEYINMGPFDVLEVAVDEKALTRLWLRGGFPDSYLAASDHDSFKLRKSFIRTYLERDVAQFGARIAAETLERLWTMLAHSQGTLLNASKLAASLAVSAPTVTGYIDLMSDLLLARRLQPFHVNVRKRLIKSAKVYVRDSGLVHALLGIEDYNELCGHPVVGASWEGFVIENLLAAAPAFTLASFYRTAAGAEIDLLLELPGRHGLWAIEIKNGLAIKVEKGFHMAYQDIKPARSFVVYAGDQSYALSKDLQAISVKGLAALLAEL